MEILCISSFVYSLRETLELLKKNQSGGHSFKYIPRPTTQSCRTKTLTILISHEELTLSLKETSFLHVWVTLQLPSSYKQVNLYPGILLKGLSVLVTGPKRKQCTSSFLCTGGKQFSLYPSEYLAEIPAIKNETNKFLNMYTSGKRLPRGHSGKESTGQCRRCKKHGFKPWVNILAWKITWTEAPGRLQSTGSQRVGHACTCMHTYLV